MKAQPKRSTEHRNGTDHVRKQTALHTANTTTQQAAAPDPADGPELSTLGAGATVARTCLPMRMRMRCARVVLRVGWPEKVGVGGTCATTLSPKSSPHTPHSEHRPLWEQSGTVAASSARCRSVLSHSLEMPVLMWSHGRGAFSRSEAENTAPATSSTARRGGEGAGRGKGVKRQQAGRKGGSTKLETAIPSVGCYVSGRVGDGANTMFDREPYSQRSDNGMHLYNSEALNICASSYMHN